MKYIIIKVSKILNINLPRFINNKELAFSYIPNVIYYKYLKKTNFYAAIFHELRHHYQYIYMKKNSDSLSLTYEIEFSNYDKFNYYNLNIELDAYAFSYIMMKKIFNIDFDFKIIKKERIISYIYDNFDLYEEYLKLWINTIFQSNMDLESF